MLKKMVQGTVIVLAVLVVFLWGFKAYLDNGYIDRYDNSTALNPLEGGIERVQDTEDVFGVEVDRNFRRQELSFEARPGESVPTLMTLPPEGDGPFPAIVFVHGSGQSKNFIEEISTPFNEAGFIMVSYDQHMRGKRKVEGNLAQALAWRERAWKTIADTRRLIDYLETREEVDPARIYLVGASWGAITGTTVVAQDKRIKAAVLVVGGGDIDTMLDAPLIRDNVPGIALALAKPVVKYLMSEADPVRHAHLTAPTPVLMQCGSDDALVSPEAGEALYAAMADPKELRWYPIDHPGLRKTDGPEILRMLNEGLAWLDAQDQKYRPIVASTPAAATAAGEESGDTEEANTVTQATTPAAAL